MVKAISRSQYGICYLSEPSENDSDDIDKLRYVDNANVLIEAGMLYALRSSQFAATIAWIPIRESDENTNSIPFDFVVERMIQVPRAENGELVLKEFDQRLTSGIDAMLKMGIE
ncbi:MAG: hypothetical protein AB8B87_27620 [Granulosicoccus sp.]